VDQNLAATAQTLDIHLEGFHSTSPIFATGFASESASISVGFDLTQESSLFHDATGHHDAFANASWSGELLDAHGAVILPDLFNPPDSRTLLAPGMYLFDMSAEGSSAFSFLSPGFDEFNVEVFADFTPVVPEPRGSVVATLLASMLAGYAVFRRRRLL
jgi:hypothetical protein